MASISVVIPAFNEENGVGDTVRAVRKAFETTSHDLEIIVVDDCSTDRTRQFAEEAGAYVITHPRNAGYGNSISTGVRNARHPWIGITDADGTYPVEELPGMLEETVSRDLDMLVGARQGKHYRGSAIKSWVRVAFKLLSEFTVGQKIPDINSGLRVMRRDMLLRFAPVMSGGFSYTTTITIIAFLTYHFVDYRPIAYHPRIDASHVRYVRDTLRAAQIIIMTILFFNPIKLFILECLFALLCGCVIAVLAFLIPQVAPALLILAVTIAAVNTLAGLGFLAEQRRIQYSGIAFPERGYVPLDRRGP
ncbi:MAG: glycosyltransferase family 2 protein [Candidatus Hydrogenedentes bacterium]|nr:glycosyltransferase family 2 protein [Candidatus Hydrogenedentota bacterium]